MTSGSRARVKPKQHNGTDLPLIRHDLHQADYLDDQTRLFLTPRGTFDELWWGNLTLQEGMGLRFFAHDVDEAGNRDDLIAEGTAHYDEQLGRWVGIVPRGAFRNLSDIAADPSHWAHTVDWAAVWARECKLLEKMRRRRGNRTPGRTDTRRPPLA